MRKDIVFILDELPGRGHPPARRLEDQYISFQNLLDFVGNNVRFVEIGHNNAVAVMLERTLGKLNHCGRKRAALTIDAAAGINDEKVHE